MDQFLEAFMRLETSSDLQEAWKCSALVSILGKLVNMYNLDLSESIEWFSEPSVWFDSFDTLTEKISIIQFKRRFGNLLLSKSFECQKLLKGSLKDYAKKQRSLYNDKLLFSDKYISLKGYLKENSESWITPLMGFYNNSLQKIFREVSKQEVTISKENCKVFFRKALNLMKLTVPEHSQLSFFKTMSISPLKKYTFKQTLSLISDWANKNRSAMNIYDNAIEKTVIDFGNLRSFVDGPLLNILNNLIKDLGVLVNKKRERSKNTSYWDAIHKVFNFYAKKNTESRFKTQFYGVETKERTLTLPAFLKFCYDFSVLNESNLVTKTFCSSVFKQISTDAFYIDESQFIECLNHISISFYSEKFDKIYGTDHADKLPKNKKYLFYSYLTFDKPSLYSEKLRGRNFTFNSERNSEKSFRLNRVHKKKIKLSNGLINSSSVLRTKKPMLYNQNSGFYSKPSLKLRSESNSKSKANSFVTFQNLDSHRDISENLRKFLQIDSKHSARELTKLYPSMLRNKLKYK